MTTTLDKEAIVAAYEDVRSDGTDTKWMTLKYHDNTLTISSMGDDYDEFREQFSDSERVFGFVRVTAGDELSKRSKFLLICWVGVGVNPMQRARSSTDKIMVKDICKSYAVEIQATEAEQLEMDHWQELISQASGANYGTGVRKSAANPDRKAN